MSLRERIEGELERVWHIAFYAGKNYTHYNFPPVKGELDKILAAVAEEVEGMPLLEVSELKQAHFEGVYDYPITEINEITYDLDDAEADKRVAKAQRANIVTELRKEGST